MNGTLFNLWFSSVYAAPNVYRYPTRWFWYIFLMFIVTWRKYDPIWWAYIFQMGWSHHLQRLPHGVVLSIVSWLNISTTIPRERCETQGKNMVKQQLVLKDERKHRKSKIHTIYTYIYIYMLVWNKSKGGWEDLYELPFWKGISLRRIVSDVSASFPIKQGSFGFQVYTYVVCSCLFS